MFCLHLLVWMLQSISTEHPWTRVMFLVIQGLRENLGVIKSHEDIQGSYNFHFLSKIPKRNEMEKDGDAMSISFFLSRTSTIIVLTREVSSGRDSNVTRHIFLFCFTPQYLLSRSPLPIEENDCFNNLFVFKLWGNYKHV